MIKKGRIRGSGERSREQRKNQEKRSHHEAKFILKYTSRYMAGAQVNAKIIELEGSSRPPDTRALELSGDALLPVVTGHVHRGNRVKLA